MTGNRGVIGRQIYQRLLSNGYSVVGSRRINQELIKGIDDVVITPWLPIALEEFRPDYVIHLAGYYGTSQDLNEIRNTVDSNVGLSASIAELISRLRVPVIATGSFSEKYPGPEGLNYYAATKIAGKSLISQAAVNCKVKFDYVYLYDTYSLDTSRGKFIDLLWNLRKDSPPLPTSGGNQVQDLVYIEDIVDCYLKLLSLKGFEGGICNDWQIRTGKELTLAQVAKIIGEIKGFNLPIEWGRLPYRQREVFKLWDCAQNLNDRAVTTSLRDGLQKMTILL